MALSPEIQGLPIVPTDEVVVEDIEETIDAIYDERAPIGPSIPTVGRSRDEEFED